MRSLSFALIAGALAIGCQSKNDLGMTSDVAVTSAQMTAPARDAAPAQPPVVPAAAPTTPQPRSMPMFAMNPSPVGEQSIDTSTAAPVLTTHDLKTSKVRTVSDERLPGWVPKRGRLTVVDSSDLAENLGLVPKGTTKTAGERISVADKLAEEGAARAAKGDSMQQGTSWSYARAGKFRSRR